MPQPITDNQKKLAERLANAKTKTVLYVDYYYFALEIDGYYEFWFNNNHYIDRVKKEEMSRHAIEYLKYDCPKFTNFYKKREFNKNSKVTWKPNSLYPQRIPEIGNAYSLMTYKIITEKDDDRNQRIIHLHEDWGNGGCADFETIGEKEVEAFLTLTVTSESHKTIKSVHELDCFRRRY